MRMLLCDNALINEDTAREINIKSIKDYYTSERAFEFFEVADENDYIYKYETDDDYMCLRTLQVCKGIDHWKFAMKEIINQFCVQYPDGFFVVHLGIGGHVNTNFYNNPAIQAIMHSDISVDKVIVYTTKNISVPTFLEETNENFKLIGGTTLQSLMHRIDDYINEQ